MQSKPVSKSKSMLAETRAPRSAPQLPAAVDLGLGAFACRLDRRKLHVEVMPTARATPATIDRLVEGSADVACDAVVVSVPKASAAFADWMRRLLYAGFTVVSKRDSWDVPLSPGAVACVLDLSDRSSSSSSGDSSVLTDDGDSDDSDESEDEDWLDDD